MNSESINLDFFTTPCSQRMQRILKSTGLAVPVLFGEPAILPMLFLLAVVYVKPKYGRYTRIVRTNIRNRWLLPQTPYPDQIRAQIQVQYESLPSVYIDWHPNQTFQQRFQSNKTALYLETRSDRHFMTPLLLHMMEVVPPDWRFLFLGSDETSRIVASTLNAQAHLEEGRLVVRSIEGSKWVGDWGRRWEDIGLDEVHNRLLTNATFYKEVLDASAGTENLLVFRSESILCTNAASDLNDWLQYDWVGAPWLVKL